MMPDFFGNPSHHAYLDLFTGLRTPVTANALGQPIDTITWGIKNYVEGACYVGILPLLLAAGAILGRAGRHKWFFAGLGRFRWPLPLAAGCIGSSFSCRG